MLVTGLAALTTEQMLLEHFSKFARISSVQISRDHRSKEPRGLGYITLEDPDDAAHVLAAEHNILQRTVQVHVTSKKCQRRVLHSQKMNARVYVYGLPCLTDSEDLRIAFEEFGKVELAKVAIDPSTKEPKSFGCVNFQTPEMAQKALSAVVYIRGAKTEVTRARRPGFGPISRKSRTRSMSGDDMFISDEFSYEASNRSYSEDGTSEKTEKDEESYSPTPNFIEEEVSNYQSLGLNPLVNLVIGTTPLVQAFYYGWFDIELVKPLSKAPGIKQELQKIRILEPERYKQVTTEPDQIKIPKYCKKTLRIPHILTDQLNQDKSNYAIRLQKPAEFLKRNAAQASFVSRKKLLRRFQKRERRLLASQSTKSTDNMEPLVEPTELDAVSVDPSQ